MKEPSRLPRRGEIWFVKLPVDPPEKGLRPAIIVSVDIRNFHPRAETVLVVPLTTSIHKDSPTQIVLPAGKTGFPEDCAARAENIVMIRKDGLVAPRSGPLQISHTRTCQLGRLVQVAIGCG